ncbi:MAG: PAS domain-containing sensor histidine kinase [Verrucomicrobia bacterium]|nr:PAS domain-containing sensor histidine kinase [Verrucomicrobiota bacterium]
MSRHPKEQSRISTDGAEGMWVSKVELTRLRTNLQEAQQTLDAIRNGEVDAIVVSESQIYTLVGAEHPYRVYVEQMQEGAVTVAAGGMIMYCNQKFAEMVGAPLDQVISSNISARLSAPAWENISSVISGASSVFKCESYLNRDNGDCLPVHLTASTLRLSDQTVACLVVMDLTRQKADEQLRLAKEVAERANLAKDNFLATLSHELRTPLTPALVAIFALQEDDTLPPRVLKDLAMIRRNIETETRLIDDLLDVTRIVHGKLELREAALDLHVVLRRAIDVCLVRAETKRVNVSVTFNATDASEIGDALRLQQVFWNVIHNAIKFTPTGGSIRILTHNPEPRVFEAIVSDSGIGFDSADAPKIFESFEQAGPDRARRFGGLGLGLWISRSIVVAHGGEIWGESPGANLGSTFHISLPLRPDDGHVQSLSNGARGESV